MFSLSARFRKSRTPGVEGSVYYIIRNGKTERNITGNLRGMDESIMSAAKDRIAFDLMTIYCVIKSLLEENREITLDEIASSGTKAILGDNPFAERLKSYAGIYPISDEIASISKKFSDRFERVRHPIQESHNAVTGLIGYISTLISEYKDKGKPFARSLRSTQLKLMGYINNAVIPIASITPAFILGYKAYLSDNLSIDTVSFYLRTLRTVLRRAGKDGLLPDGFVWPSNVNLTVSRTSPRANTNAVDIETIHRIENLDLADDRTLDLARDMFMFGFYAKGMEFVDVANLKVENLNGNILTYRRRLKGKERTEMLGKGALSIIRKYQDKSRDYLFPLLQRRWMYSYTTVRSEIAISLKRIGQMLGLPIPLTYSMNIYSWQSIIRNANIAKLLIC